LPGGIWHDPLDRNDPMQWSSLGSMRWYFYVNPANWWSNYPRPAQEGTGTEIILEDGLWSDPTNVWPWGAAADADGDGITDARWVRIPGLRGPQGEYLYAAIRIIDNGAALNVDTAYANDEQSKGEWLTEVSLEGMARPSLTPAEKLEDVKDLHADRDATGTYADDMGGYYRNIVLSLDSPTLGVAGTRLFDLSDELELRTRYFLDAMSRTALEYTWQSYLSSGNTYKRIPYDDLTGWFNNLNWRDTQEHEATLDRRHFLTTHSWDRTIGGNISGGADVEGFERPEQDDVVNAGQKVKREHGAQANINLDEAAEIAWALGHAFANGGDPNDRKTAAQLACNIVDYRDSDTVPSYIHYASSGSTPDTYVFGHEPQPYISKLIATIATNPTVAGANTFQVELYNPYSTSLNLSDFLVRVYDSGGIQLSETSLSGTLTSHTSTGAPETIGEFATFKDLGAGNYDVEEYYIVTLVRVVDSQSALLDKWECPEHVDGGWLHWNGSQQEESRTTADWSVIWDPAPTRNYNLDIPGTPFRTVGEVTRILKIGPPWLDSSGAVDIVGTKTVGEILQSGSTISTGRLDMEDSDDALLLNYLAVLTRMDDTDKNGDGQKDDASELRIPGRININTAPRRIIASIPWVQNLQDSPNPPMTEEDKEKLSLAITAYRDKVDLSADGGPDYSDREAATGITGIRSECGFANIGELLNVTRADGGDAFFDIRRWGKNTHNDDTSGDPNEGPWFDAIADTAEDDLEERDVLFHRMSNLVTVRSDVFTAYILVRLGERGPERRVMALLDRSNVFKPTDAVRVVALHPVPDPR